ncbi:MAG: hypothetical protein ACTS8H_03515 [Arsenophonus sp. NC-PE1-MAG3]
MEKLTKMINDWKDKLNALFKISVSNENKIKYHQAIDGYDQKDFFSFIDVN